MNFTRVFLTTGFVIAMWGLPVSPIHAQEQWTPGLALEVERVSNVMVSPDGNRVVFQVAEAAMDGERSEWLSHLHLVPVNDDELPQESRRLTEGEFNAGTPFRGNAFDWSPDGETIVFIHAPTPKVDDWTRADVSLVDVESGSTARWPPPRPPKASPSTRPTGAGLP